MYNGLFLASQGSNLLSVLGALESIKEKLSHIKYWNTCGNSALILFFKLLGYTFEQTLNHLSELKILVNTINASSLMPEDEEKRKEYVREWLTNKIEENKLFNSDVTLEETYQQTNILPSFILWSRNKEKIMNINAEHNPTIKLIDVVLASLTALGFYSTYKIKNTVFSNIFSIDCYPYLYTILNEDTSYLYVANISTINDKIQFNLGPMQDRENELIRQFYEHNNFRIHNISKTIKSSKIMKIYTILQRGELSPEASQSLFRIGQKQGIAYLEDRDTKLEADHYLEIINAQS